MKILFQGDSITDAERSREYDEILGVGYPLLVSAQIGFENPGKYEFVNKGIAGNRIVDLYARIKTDIINLKPDVLSILIGVNDAWDEFIRSNGVSTAKFEKIYDMLIGEIKEVLPDIKIMILEPFVLRAPRIEEYWDAFYADVKEKATAAKSVAEKYSLPFIKLQDKFDEAAKTAPADYWLKDGVHPTFSGHELIKREWIKMFNTL